MQVENDPDLSNIREPQPIFVRYGKKQGRKIGLVFYKKNYPPYLYILKNYKENQIFYKQKFRDCMWLSVSGIKDAIRAGAQLVIYHIANYEAGRTIYVVFKINEFLMSENEINFDDKQKGVLWKNKTRLYEFPRSLWEYIDYKKEGGENVEKQIA